MNELAQAMKKVDVESAASNAATQLRPTSIQGPGRVPARRASDRGELGSEQLEHLDRMTNAAVGKLTMGVSPVSLAMSWFDWAAHLAASPGKQFQLGQKLLDKVQAWNTYALESALDCEESPAITPARDDHRFAHEGWKRYPFNLISQGFLLTEDWWREATTGIRGVSRHNEAGVSFVARQLLDMAAPSNLPLFNPEVIETTIEERGANLLRGAAYYVDDLRRFSSNEEPV